MLQVFVSSVVIVYSVQAQAKQDFLEAQVERTKLKEGELAVQLGKVKEEVRE